MNCYVTIICIHKKTIIHLNSHRKAESMLDFPSSYTHMEWSGVRQLFAAEFDEKPVPMGQTEPTVSTEPAISG